MNPTNADPLIERLERLHAVGVALSAEKDIGRLLAMILRTAKSLVNADAGTLYRVGEDGCLHFEILLNDTLDLERTGSSDGTGPFQPIPLRLPDGSPNDTLVVANAVLHGRTVVIDDAYAEDAFDFSGTHRFDQRTGYRSRSFLTVPMRDHEHQIIGVLQLINAKDADSGAVIPFSAGARALTESLASQAAVALTNRRLINQLEALFESFIRLINLAIDEKSPYTGGHCQRVPILTMMLADAAHRASHGPLADFRMSEADRHELHIAGLLHDCGKVTTPVHVVDKSTKLETLFDRIHLVEARLETLRRDADIAHLRALLDLRARLPAGDQRTAAEAALDAERTRRLAAIADDRAFLRRCNSGGEFMATADQERVEAIARQRWIDMDGVERPLLSEDEVYNLKIARGTLTPEEREIINQHIVSTIRMLEALPWPRHLLNVPAYAGGHHERMDGKGYPRGLTGAQMPLQARIMAIADVFEALTAPDRPYKPGKTLSESLELLGRMKLDGHIDPDLFDLFVRDKVYLRYAERHMDAAQIDTVDETRIPGYTP
jgi:HD-GYP domain-containing protein (c-di-GMP phosphodiesterase class II)